MVSGVNTPTRPSLWPHLMIGQKRSIRQQTDVMTLDFSKLFDVVAHQWLLSKLSSCVIRGNVHTWVANFLSSTTSGRQRWSVCTARDSSGTASLSDLHQWHNRRHFIRTPIICRRLFVLQRHQIHPWLRDSAARSWLASKVVWEMAYEV